MAQLVCEIIQRLSPEDTCHCIPAADNPEVASADEADWLESDDNVFGIEVTGEYQAYPRRIMEVREMVIDCLGGLDLGAHQAFWFAGSQFYSDTLLWPL